MSPKAQPWLFGVSSWKRIAWYEALMISAMAGHDLSLDMIKKGYTHGEVTKEDFAKALRAHKEHTDEVKSDQRDKVTISGTEYHHSEIKTVEERLDIRGALRHASTALDATPSLN